MNGRTYSDRATGTGLLRRLRESRGWSQSSLARALSETVRQLSVPGLASIPSPTVDNIRRNIVNWENPTGSTIPTERYQILLAYVYARTPSGGVALDEGSDFGTVLTALRYLGVTAGRLQEVADVVAHTATREGIDLRTLLPSAARPPLTVARGAARVSPTLVHALATTTGAINAEVGTASFAHLYLRLSPVLAACREALATTPPDLREELAIVATQTFVLAGRLAWEMRVDDAARGLYAEAITTAGWVPDRRYRAAARISLTLTILHGAGGPQAAYSPARTAIRDARRGSSAAVRARAYAVYAEICARGDRAADAGRVLDRASNVFDRSGTRGLDPVFTPQRLAGFAGLCEMYAGHPGRAASQLTHAVAALTGPRDSIQRAIVTVDLAQAHLAQGDPSACADLLRDAVDLAAATGGRVPVQRIGEARRRLRPWRTEPWAGQLDDYIYERLLGT